jgi:hypothetical protein
VPVAGSKTQPVQHRYDPRLSHLPSLLSFFFAFGMYVMYKNTEKLCPYISTFLESQLQQARVPWLGLDTWCILGGGCPS